MDLLQRCSGYSSICTVQTILLARFFFFAVGLDASWLDVCVVDELGWGGVVWCLCISLRAVSRRAYRNSSAEGFSSGVVDYEDSQRQDYPMSLPKLSKLDGCFCRCVGFRSMLRRVIFLEKSGEMRTHKLPDVFRQCVDPVSIVSWTPSVARLDLSVLIRNTLRSFSAPRRMSTQKSTS